MSHYIIKKYFICALILALSSAHKPLQPAPDPIEPGLYNLATTAYHNAIKKGVAVNKPIITIIDFSKPSNEKRLWVVNLQTKKILLGPTYVAQGRHTGLRYARNFSNTINSHDSSIGLYLTAHSYFGKHGYALRVIGLDPGFNSNAYKRDIVIHKAWYVSERFVDHYHRAGRSYGCFAVDPAVNAKFINLIKNGSLLLSYYPDRSWLKNSVFLK